MTERGTLANLKPTDLPAPPQEAIGIVRACAHSDITSKRLAEIVTHNAVLTAELLRIVNSAFFGFRAKATSAAHAVTLLGQRALRNLALCVAMRDALRPDAIPGLDMAAYWEQALRRAVAARCLSQVARLNGEDCFTAGLLQDFGLLVMLYIDQDRAGEWRRLAEADPDERYALEQSLFQTTHDHVGGALAVAWELPPELRQVMAAHHSLRDIDTAETQVLCKLAQCADWMAAVFTAADKRPVIRRCHQLLQDYFGLTAEQSNDLLDEVAQGIGAAGTAMGLSVGAQITLADVLREANLQLVEDNLSYQELTWRLEQALAERDRIAAELNRELELAREVQRSLMPRDSDGQGCSGAGIHGVNTAARELSGDFYDYFPTRNGQIHFCIADVSGKGMNAALLMAKVSSLFRCLAKNVADPAALLTMLNREIVETSVRGMFVTMIGGRYDPRTGQVWLANAGHLPALYMPTLAPMQELPADAPPLGVLADVQFVTQELNLAGGALYLYTDGLIEARMPSGDELGIAGLKALLRKHADVPTVQRARRLLDAVRDAEIRDDLTLLMIDSQGLSHDLSGSTGS
ncbi:MAG: HDOD domain-containing protein [Gammaproteobacteria bacterium]|nr:HDOD domain-containing protein [Gammaproteobacteria bacterium]